MSESKPSRAETSSASDSKDLAVTLTVGQLCALVHGEMAKAIAGQATEREVLMHEEAADLLQINPRTLTRFVEQYDIPVSMMGNERRYRRSELLAWLASRRLQKRKESA